MAKIEKMFGAILKDQEQKSDELRDKIHAENKLKKKDEEAMMRKQSLKKAAALAISVMCMEGVLTGCGNSK